MSRDQEHEPAPRQPDQREVSESEPRHVLLTRAQAARRMGVSLATVRRMEGAELRPIVVDGKHCFPIDEVDRHRRVTDGDLAATAFQMFNDDKSQVDTVIALKEPPERIRKLFNEWVEMSGCIVAAAPPLGYRRYWRAPTFRLTRALVTVCVSLVLKDPKLRERAERQLGYSLDPMP